jgi:hypothetical protein
LYFVHTVTKKVVGVFVVRRRFIESLEMTEAIFILDLLV